MSSVSWWRSWHGAPMDPKWAVIASRAGVKIGIVSAVAWALLDYASQHGNRGTVEGFDIETYAVFSGWTEREIESVISAMTDKGVIANGRLVNWEKRQPKREDDSKERVARYREKKRNVTQSNDDVTQSSVSVSLSDSVIKDSDEKNEVSAISREFTSVTGILPYEFDKWNEAEQTLNRMKVDPVVIRLAVDKLKDDEMSVTGLWSITKTAISLNADRLAGRPLNGKPKKFDRLAMLERPE